MHSKLKMFDYNEAFIRNIGWITKAEQKKISHFRIAIAGMGGVGGHHLHALLRLGFQRFKIADLDTFDIQNFNRQFGATISTLGKPKLDVLANMSKEINPDVEIKCYEKGITLDNKEDFLKDVDLVIDGLDLYASHLRSPLYELAHKMGVPVVSAGPFGMGTSIVTFDPKGISFNEYFDLNLEGLTVEAMIIRFLVGMSPSFMHTRYVGEPSQVALFEQKLPSLHIGCYMASAAVSSFTLKLAINRGDNLFAPRGYQVDLFYNKMKKFWRPMGNRNPLQRILIKKIHRMFEVREFK